MRRVFGVHWTLQKLINLSNSYLFCLSEQEFNSLLFQIFDKFSIHIDQILSHFRCVWAERLNKTIFNLILKKWSWRKISLLFFMSEVIKYSLYKFPRSYYISGITMKIKYESWKNLCRRLSQVADYECRFILMIFFWITIKEFFEFAHTCCDACNVLSF